MPAQPALLLILLSSLGAAGLYLAFAGRQRGLRWGALLILAAAGGTLLALAAPHVAGGATRGWFGVLAVVGLLGAVRMITHRRPVYSALYFILVIVSVTGLLLLMDAQFLAASLMIIYAGAILVTYVFVIMLAQQSGPAGYDSQPREPFLGCIAGFAVLTVIAARMFSGAPPDAPVAAVAKTVLDGTPQNVGTVLLTDYVVALQVAAVVLLAALVGAIAIARRKPVAGGEEVD
ncbi:MAG: NADH-quinone oxidoreductase subunit J [Phycisphaerae bacterium]|jgi:NADH-quinone oxidoreductase subunit J